MRLRGLLVWLALTLTVFGVVETWLGSSIGEMQNFILAGLVFLLASKEFK